jgi:hypothetical protein
VGAHCSSRPSGHERAQTLFTADFMGKYAQLVIGPAGSGKVTRAVFFPGGSPSARTGAHCPLFAIATFPSRIAPLPHTSRRHALMTALLPNACRPPPVNVCAAPPPALQHTTAERPLRQPGCVLLPVCPLSPVLALTWPGDGRSLTTLCLPVCLPACLPAQQHLSILLPACAAPP